MDGVRFAAEVMPLRSFLRCEKQALNRHRWRGVVNDAEPWLVPNRADDIKPLGREQLVVCDPGSATSRRDHTALSARTPINIDSVLVKALARAFAGRNCWMPAPTAPSNRSIRRKVDASSVGIATLQSLGPSPRGLPRWR